ncbi:MAG: DUF4124 domain-containing protein [Proteobacteria bacterium]|nr:DUF4124 domain-containing protein [Pseudomonadota bacterium]
MKLSRIYLIICGFPLAIQLLLAAPTFSETLYTWTDKNGVVRRTYYPPPPDYSKRSAPAQESSSQRTAQQNQVEIYVTSSCPYCKQARQFFESRGISYKAYDIEKDEQAAARKKKLGSEKGVPFAIINGTAIHGYSPQRYTSALK